MRSGDKGQIEQNRRLRSDLSGIAVCGSGPEKNQIECIYFFYCSELFELPFPAVLTVHPGAVQPRDVGLYGISSAFDAYSVEKWDLKNIGLTAEQVGEAGSPTRVFSLKRVKKDRTCEFLSGSAEEQADALIQRLVRTGLVG